jgi:hypothetical protein
LFGCGCHVLKSPLLGPDYISASVVIASEAKQFRTTLDCRVPRTKSGVLAMTAQA